MLHAVVRNRTTSVKAQRNEISSPSVDRSHVCTGDVRSILTSPEHTQMSVQLLLGPHACRIPVREESAARIDVWHSAFSEGRCL